MLKYRLERTPDDEAAFLAAVGARFAQAANGGPVDRPPGAEQAAEDGLQALRVVREGAARWHIEPARVGMMGFSAGAMTALSAALAPQNGDRPAFLGYIYGPMEVREVPSDAPPAFVALALDDPLFGHRGFGIVQSWQRAGRPVELHGYERGDHGFGLGRPGTTTTLMFDEFVAWLDGRGLLRRARQ